MADPGVITFNVGGRLFQVLRQTIVAQPDTLLACLLDDVGTNAGEPIFVDANPDRFLHVLDWYRYNEMFLPKDLPESAILRDARFFLLPDMVTINGARRHISVSGGGTKGIAANDEYQAYMDEVAKVWTDFEAYVEQIASEARQEFAEQARKTADVEGVGNVACLTSKPDAMSVSDCEYSVQVCVRDDYYGYWGWTDNTNVCSRGRLQLLMHELEKRGFECRVKEFATIVSLMVRAARSLSSEANRIRIDGVMAMNGRLLVSQNQS